MIDLKKFFELKGLASFDDLVKYCGEECFDQLDQMMRNKEVSIHTEAMGEKKYRYPYYAIKVAGQRPGKSIKILKLIEDNPGMNAVSIRKALKISQSSFERWEGELLESGQITRVKKGVSWIYSATGVEPVAFEEAPRGLYEVWFAYTEGKDYSIQKLAEDAGVSRESAAKCREWLIDHSMVDGYQLAGFWEKTEAERRKWLKETFPEATEIHLRNIPRMKAPDSWKPVRPVGVVQSTSPAQPDELGRLILETMEDQPKWTLKELNLRVASPLWYGVERDSTVNLGAKKLIQLAQEGVIDREWDGDDETPALYSLPKFRV